MGKGSPQGQPAHTTQQTTSEYPTELKPFIKDIFGKAKGIEEQRTSQGYQPYTAPRIAEFTEDQVDAFEGIRGAQGASTPYFNRQETLIDRATRETTPELTQQYMNPYTQTVINQQLRELGRQGEQQRQKIGAGAVGAGGYGGSRQAILEAEQMRNEGMRGDDIQARGLNQAFALAQQGIQQQRAADAAGANMFGQMAQQVPGQRFKELGALAGIGAADQTQQQRALDLGYEQFTDEYNFPMKNLNEYSAILRGFPLSPTQNISRAVYSPVAPLSSQLLGAGVGLGSAAMMGGMFGASGGQVKKLQQGGLASLYNKPTNRVQMGKTNYQNLTNMGLPSPQYKDEDVLNILKEIMPKGRTGTLTPEEVTQQQEIINVHPDFGYVPGLMSSGLSSRSASGNPIINKTEVEKLIKSNINKVDNPPPPPPIPTPPEVLENFEEIKRTAAGVEEDGQQVNEEEVDINTTTTFEVPQDDQQGFTSWLSSLKNPNSEASEKRMRFATWAPVLASVESIMGAPSIGAAVGKLFTASARAAQGYANQSGKEISMATAKRKAALEGSKVMSEVYKNLSSPAAYVANVAHVKSIIDGNNGEVPRESDGEIYNEYQEALKLQKLLGDRLSTPQLEQAKEDALVGMKGLPGIVLPKDIFDDNIQAKEIYNYWKNNIAKAPVSKNKGGKIRSFDFVEEGDKLIAVPKVT